MINKLSYSSVEKYLLCPQAWYKYYLCNLREKQTGSALIFGSAIDKGINTLLESKQINPNPDNGYIFTTLIDAETKFIELINSQKINGIETDLSKTQLIKYSNADFDLDVLKKEQIEELQDFTQEKDLKSYHNYLIDLKRNKELNNITLKHFNYMSWLSLKQKGLMLINAYQEQVIPNIEEVIDIQKFFSIKNDEGDEFLGYIDYICRYKGYNGLIIKDNKTSASPYSIDQASQSKQLASYYGALQELDYTKEPLYIGFDVLVKKIRKKKEPKVQIQVLIDKVNIDLVDLVFEDYDRVNHAIHEGLFESNSPECSKNNYGNVCMCQIPKTELIDISHLKLKK